MSYARKYAFLNALNLRTGIKDDEEEAKIMKTAIMLTHYIKQQQKM